VAPILEAFGSLPLALTLAAACLRAELEQGAPPAEAVAAVAALQLGTPHGGGGGAVPAPGAWLDADSFCAALGRANERWREGDYVAIYKALQAALKAK
jgi:hypothetical protein